ncbi:hypothetical protein TSUD_45440 [Trifolium subterraneum]|nr:hypothetical protein TSUD_45440 [Trifolium subterraneum]
MQQVEEQQVVPPNELEGYIIRYRIMSHGFNSMLRENSFVNLHLSRSARNKILAEEVLDGNGQRSLRYLEVIDDNIINDDIYGGFRFDLQPRWHPVTSCNSLVCCIITVLEEFLNVHPSSDDPSVYYIEEEYKFRFVNPATREISPVSTLLPFETGHRHPLIGFGLDQVNDVYKLVVLLHAPTSAGGTFTQVFEVGSNLWRTVRQNFPGTPFRSIRDYDQAYLSFIILLFSLQNN